MILKIGDRVGLHDNIYTNMNYNPWYSTTGIKGTVHHSDGHWVTVKWDNNTHNSYEHEQVFLIMEKIIDVDELFEGIEL
jgi:hypothetical protein